MKVYLDIMVLMANANVIFRTRFSLGIHIQLNVVSRVGISEKDGSTNAGLSRFLGQSF